MMEGTFAAGTSSSEGYPLSVIAPVVDPAANRFVERAANPLLGSIGHEYRMKPTDTNSERRSVAERAFEVIDRMNLRDFSLILPLLLSIVILSSTVVGFRNAPSVADTGLADHAETYRSDAEKGEYERCRPEEHGNAPAGHDVGARDHGQKKAHEEDTTLCLTRLTVREAMVANQIALQYNAISADAAWWSRLGGILVTVLGIVSVIGIIVAVLAASDARRAIDFGAMSVAIAQRSSRAYLNILASDAGYGPPRVRNGGNTPVAISAVLVAYPDRNVDDLDLSVMKWADVAARYDMVAPSDEKPIILPFVARNRLYGIVVGIAFADVHGRKWCSWRHCRLDMETGVLGFGRSSEFPLG